MYQRIKTLPREGEFTTALGPKEGDCTSCNRTSTTHNLVEEGEYTTAIDVRRGEQTSESDKTPQQQDSAQRASVIKAHNLQ
jgi:hypothetical protein